MLQTIAAFDRIGEENAFAVLARANALAAQGRDIINLGIGQPDFRTPDHIVEAAIKALRDGHHGYTPATGIPPLREAVAADLHKRFKVKVSPDEVMIMPGGKPTMFMSILMFGEPGADILYPDPGFPIYRSMIEFTGARPVPVPIREENGFAFSAEETLSLITPQTRLLILNSPANPTGGVTPKTRSRQAGRRPREVSRTSRSCRTRSTTTWSMTARQHVCLLTYPSIRDRLILLNGWSKTYAMTGWRLGYAVWPGKLYDYGAQARGQPALLRQRLGAICRPCRAHRPAGRGGQDGRGVRQAPQSRGRRPEQAARRVVRDAEGRVLCVPERQAHRLEGEAARQRAARRGRRRRHRRPGFRHSRRRLYAAVLRQLDREHPEGARPHGRVPEAARRRNVSHVMAGLVPAIHVFRLHMR